MEKTKKPSKAQLESKIENAILLVEKGKEFKAFRFSDMGISIKICQDYTMLESNFHRNVWNNITSNGYSNVYVLLNEVVSIATQLKDDIAVKNDKDEIEYHFGKLKDLDYIPQADKNILNLFEKWVYLLNDSPFMIGSEKINILSIVSSYIIWLSKNQILYSERNEDLTINKFYNELIKNIRYLSLNTQDDMNEKQMQEFKTLVSNVEDNAFVTINDYLANKDIQVADYVALPKLTDEDANAMAIQLDDLR